MAVEKIHIDRFLELANQYPVFDVRSPGEYNHAHIPGAISLPLFSDNERAEVGTAYKQESRAKAIRIGLDFFGPKMRNIVETVESIGNQQPATSSQRSAVSSNGIVKELPTANPPDRQAGCILIYCWRGGMRSGAVSWLLDLYGFKVYALVGGYKKFRHHVLDSFKEQYNFKIIGGYTGSGKTEVLKELEKRGEKIVDLEDIAKHKGSAFGNIGMPAQPTQEMFENLLACKLQAVTADCRQGTEHCIWLEDESQRIGLVNLPNELWKRMRQSSIYFLDVPFEERLAHLIEEYGELDRQRMIDAIRRIKDRLGSLEAKNAINLLESNNTIESFRILLKYYDKWYLKGLHNRTNTNSLLHLVKCDSVTTENANRLPGRHQYHETISA